MPALIPKEVEIQRMKKVHNGHYAWFNRSISSRQFR
jgi:hypothetical protein